MLRLAAIKIIVFTVLVLVVQTLSANEITIERTNHLRDSRSPNSVGFSIGDVQVFGVDLTPNGDLNGDGFADSDGSTPPSTVYASQGSSVFRLHFYPIYGNPNHFVTAIPYNSDLAYSWEFHITNGNDTAVAYSPSIHNVEPMPFVTSMSLTGSGTTPTFHWRPPLGSPHDLIAVWIFDLQDYIGSSARNIYISYLDKTATSFQVPDGILDPYHLYSVAIQLYGLRELPAGGNPYSTTTERLSRSFFDFSTEILQIPDDAPVYLPSVDPSGSPTGDAIYTFHLEVEAGQTVFIDPVVAVGYDYEIGDGDPNFKSVMLPEVGDNKFNLYLFNGENYAFEAIIKAEDLYSFDSDGVDRFRIMGIEASAGLDTNNATAFPTALTFVSDGSFTGTMTPMVVNQVDIDIKPGSYPNCLNMNGHGLITVAVLGSNSLDVSQVDISTLKFAGLDVRVKGNSNPQCSIEDVSGDFTDPAGAPDGFDDLVCHFIDDPSAWSPVNGTATLSVALLDGTLIEGTDSLCIVP